VPTLELITPDWPAPARVRAFATTRGGGVSEERYASLNLALHTGDAADRVVENRRRLGVVSKAPHVCWLEQVHGIVVADADASYAAPPRADASIGRRAGNACAILTADCLPVLLCNEAGTIVAAAHCGWRGLAHGVLTALLTRIATPGTELMAWLGPAIGPARYEVGDDVRRELLRRIAAPVVAAALRPGKANGKWWADLYALARAELSGLGVSRVYGGDFCTFDEPRFYSYRRDGVTGRMAALIWLSDDPRPV
jgi:YfiH family protein